MLEEPRVAAGTRTPASVSWATQQGLTASNKRPVFPSPGGRDSPAPPPQVYGVLPALPGSGAPALRGLAGLSSLPPPGSVCTQPSLRRLLHLPPSPSRTLVTARGPSQTQTASSRSPSPGCLQSPLQRRLTHRHRPEGWACLSGATVSPTDTTCGLAPSTPAGCSPAAHSLSPPSGREPIWLLPGTCQRGAQPRGPPLLLGRTLAPGGCPSFAGSWVSCVGAQPWAGARPGQTLPSCFLPVPYCTPSSPSAGSRTGHQSQSWADRMGQRHPVPPASPLSRDSPTGHGPLTQRRTCQLGRAGRVCSGAHPLPHFNKYIFY